MATDSSQSNRGDEYSLLGLVAFLVVVGFFAFVSTKAGTRAMGACMFAGSLMQLREGRVGYGWKGQPPSGYITGGPARLLILVFGALGVAVFFWPEVAMGILGWDRG